jgi:hypothetical protein
MIWGVTTGLRRSDGPCLIWTCQCCHTRFSVSTIMSQAHALDLRLDIRLETTAPGFSPMVAPSTNTHPRLSPSPQASALSGRRHARNIADPLRIAKHDETRLVLNGTNGTASARSVAAPARSAPTHRRRFPRDVEGGSSAQIDLEAGRLIVE